MQDMLGWASNDILCVYSRIFQSVSDLWLQVAEHFMHDEKLLFSAVK